MRPVLCLCSRFPDCSDVRSRLLLVVHRRELRTTTNTGKLAVSMVPESGIHLRGAKEDPPLSSETLAAGAGDRVPLLLFPGAGSQELNSESAARWTDHFQKGVFLVVPDGTWSQAVKIGQRERALVDLPRVHLPPGADSSYRLRWNPHRERVSTFEAISRALGIVEGPVRGPTIQKAWEEFFQIRVEWALWARGLMTAENMRVPPPYDAVQEFFIAGARGTPSRRSST